MCDISNHSLTTLNLKSASFFQMTVNDDSDSGSNQHLPLNINLLIAISFQLSTQPLCVECSGGL